MKILEFLKNGYTVNINTNNTAYASCAFRIVNGKLFYKIGGIGFDCVEHPERNLDEMENHFTEMLKTGYTIEIMRG